MASTGTIEKIKRDIQKTLREDNQLTKYLAMIEEKTKIDRLYLVLVPMGLFSLYLVIGYFAELVCNLVGFAYPAYVSIKAIESVDKADDTQWLTYWVVFAIFQVIEFFTEIFIGWFPIYWLCKCGFMLYLHLPFTRGAEKLYETYIRKIFIKHQGKIDQTLHAATKVADSVSKEALAAASNSYELKQE